MSKISKDKLNRDAFKPITEGNVLTKAQFDSFVKANDFEIFDIQGLNRYRVAIFKAIKANPTQEKEILQKAKSEFAELGSKRVIQEDGSVVETFFRKKEITDNLQKGFNPNKKDEEDNQDQTSDPKQSSKQEPKDNKEDAEEGEKGNGTEEEDNQKGDSELTPEEQSVLDIIKQILSSEQGADGVSEKELNDQDGFADEQTKQILQSLISKGLIEADVDDNGNINVIGIAGDSTDNQDTDQDPNASKNPNQDPNQQQADPNQQQQDPKQQDQQAQGQGQQQGAQDQQQGDPNKIREHAKSTDTEQLKKFIADPNNHPDHKEVAKQELKDRGEDPDANPEEEQKEFDSWIDNHFGSHDIEDLVDYTKKLIIESPAELKVLKDHYRQDYSKKNGGNRADKIDAEDFDEYLTDYLSHQPFEHLKKYAKSLVSKNPKAFKQLQSSYKDLKDNNML